MEANWQLTDLFVLVEINDRDGATQRDAALVD
jgi:hypothetical protein